MNENNVELLNLKTQVSFYKYRNLKNFAHFADIIINQRLYAAIFTKLNDPMEGLYFYKDGKPDRGLRDSLKKKKKQAKICSLSDNYNCSLMWTHYADEHKGVVLELSVKEFDEFRKINYVDQVRILKGSDLQINSKLHYTILSEKLKSWETESEVRFFKLGLANLSTHIKVDIKKIYAGVKMSKSEFKILGNFVKKYNKDIEVVRMEKRELI